MKAALFGPCGAAVGRRSRTQTPPVPSAAQLLQSGSHRGRRRTAHTPISPPALRKHTSPFHVLPRCAQAETNPLSSLHHGKLQGRAVPQALSAVPEAMQAVLPAHGIPPGPTAGLGKC